MRLFQNELLFYNNNWNNWKTISLNPGWTSEYSSWNDIKYTYGTGFIIVGSEGKIIQSYNGIDFENAWNPTYLNNNITDRINSVSISTSNESNSVKYFITTNHNIYASYDSFKIFDFSTSINDGSIECSTYGKNKFISAGNPGLICITNEKISKGKMTTTYYTYKTGTGGMYCVNFNSTHSIFFAMGGSYNHQRLYYLSDGTNWTEVTVGSNTRIYWTDIIYLKKVKYNGAYHTYFLLLGNNGNNTYISYCKSINTYYGDVGVDSTYFDYTDWLEPVYITDYSIGNKMIFANNRIVICGSNGTILTSPEIKTTSDIDNLMNDRTLWKKEQTPVLENWKALAASNERVVIIGKKNIAYKKIRNII